MTVSALRRTLSRPQSCLTARRSPRHRQSAQHSTPPREQREGKRALCRHARLIARCPNPKEHPRSRFQHVSVHLGGSNLDVAEPDLRRLVLGLPQLPLLVCG